MGVITVLAGREVAGPAVLIGQRIATRLCRGGGVPALVADDAFADAFARLALLRDRGLLADDEYDLAVARVLGT